MSNDSLLSIVPAASRSPLAVPGVTGGLRSIVVMCDADASPITAGSVLRISGSLLHSAWLAPYEHLRLSVTLYIERMAGTAVLRGTETVDWHA